MLTDTQNQVLALLAAGQTVPSAAAQCEIPRTTIHDWRHTSPEFAAAVEDAQADAAAEIRALYLAHVQAALLVLVTLLHDPKSSPSVRLRAALHILNGAATPTPSARPRQSPQQPSSDFITSAEPAAPQPEPTPIPNPVPPQPPTLPVAHASDFITGSAASDQHYLALLTPAAQAGFNEFRQVAGQTGLPHEQVLAFLHQIEAAEAAREQQQPPAAVHHTSSPATPSAASIPSQQPSEAAPASAPTPSASSKFITGSAESDARYLALLRPPTPARGADAFRQAAQVDALTDKQITALMDRYDDERDGPAPASAIHHNSSPSALSAGPNPEAPCPCGSRRKHKHCCLYKKQPTAA